MPEHNFLHFELHLLETRLQQPKLHHLNYIIVKLYDSY